MDIEAKDNDCDICLQEDGFCCCGGIVSHFKELNSYLRSLGLLEFIASPSVAAVVYNQVCSFCQF